MFYIKDTLYGAIEFTTEIGPDNVYCRCPYCGKEVQVDLSHLAAEVQSDLFGKAVLCEDCMKVKEGGKINGKFI